MNHKNDPKKNQSFHFALWMIVLAVAAVQSHAQPAYEPYTFTTLAGGAGAPGSADGVGSAARFNYPRGIAVDSTGNVYVADSGNHTIRKVAPTGVVTTLAGSAGQADMVDGTGSAARFNGPQGVTVDSAGNVYVADQNNNTIRKVTPSGVVTTLAGLAGNAGSADGTGSAARFSGPYGVSVDGAGNLYVTDQYNNTVRKVTPTGLVTTLAGLAGHNGSSDGTNSTARFDNPSDVAADSSGNLYVTDAANIRKVTPVGTNWIVTTLAGAPAGPSGVAIDGLGNLYASDFGDNTILKVTSSGVVTTLAAQFNQPHGLAVDGLGNVYVADSGNDMVRKVTPSGVVTTLAGMPNNSAGHADGTGIAAQFFTPWGDAVDFGDNVYVADTDNHVIRKVTPAGVVTTFAGNTSLIDPWGHPVAGVADGTASAAQFSRPFGVAVDGVGNVYVADRDNNAIRKITAGGVVTTLAGLKGTPGSADGTGSGAQFSGPFGVAVDGIGNLYVADTGNFTIRKVTPSGEVTTVAGLAGVTGSTDGLGTQARFGGGDYPSPAGIAVDTVGNVYVTDPGNSSIRKVTPVGANWMVTTMAKLPHSHSGPWFGASGVAVDSVGNVYVANTPEATILKVTPAGVVTTLAGSYYSSGSADGTGSAAQFRFPAGVAVDSTGNLYVVDIAYNVVRKGYGPLEITSSGPSFGLHEGQFGFGITGKIGTVVTVETSSDLVSWLTIWTNTLAGPLNFNEPVNGPHSNRFYRVHPR